jgi:hypothetical protein
VKFKAVSQEARNLAQPFFRIATQFGTDFHLPTGEIDPHG